MGPNGRGGGTARGLAMALGAALLVAVCLLLTTDEGPARTRIAGRLGAAVMGVLALSVYYAVERRRRRTEEDLADMPWMGGARGPVDELAPATPAEPAAGSPAPRQAAPADLDGMLAHADDALLALRDLVAHGHPERYGMLPSLLRRSGLLEWESPGPIRATRLRRNGRWWLTPPADAALSEDAYDRLTSLEAILNVSDDLMRRSWPEKASPAWRLMMDLSEVADLRPRPTESPLVAALLQGGDGDGEWACRLRFADSVENLPAPFRIEMEFQANLSRGLLGVSLVIPRPSCLGFAGARDQAAWARAYALRTALLLGRRGFASSRAVRRVVVNCHEHGEDLTRLSLDLTRGSLDRLLAAARSSRLVDEGTPDDPALRLSPGADGWLRPVEPFLELSDEALSPAERWRETELDDSPCLGPVARDCGAGRVSDLGINLGIMEKAGRAAAWNAVVGELGGTTQEAVSRLVALRDGTDDLTVAEACGRASEALVDGTVDVLDRRALAGLFVDGGPLGATVRTAHAVLAGNPTPERLEHVADALEDALAPPSWRRASIWMTRTASTATSTRSPSA